MGLLHRLLRFTVMLAVIAALSLLAYAWLNKRPQDLPWTSFDLAQPIGLFTGRKLASLTGNPPVCRALLDRAGLSYEWVGSGGRERQCRYDDAVRPQTNAEAIALSPSSVAPSCPVVAALKLWEWHVVQPKAQRLLGQPVKSITHFGSYSCRRLYGRSQGDFSEHATADAIDISGFVLADGRRISVVEGWNGEGPDAEFLRSVRDGACDLFSTVLSPDYNAAHRDHLHFDQAERGVIGWRGCR
jgi:hypothetical protein